MNRWVQRLSIRSKALSLIRGRSLLAIGLLLLNVIVSARVYQQWSADEGSSETRLAYHSPAAPAAVQELRNQLRGEWKYLVLAFSNDLSMDSLRYFDTLARAHGSRDFKLAVVTHAAPRDVARFRLTSSPLLAIVSDNTLFIHKSLHVPAGHRHENLVILDREGRLEFWNQSRPSPDELRQLVEKYANGAVDYEIKTTGLFARLAVGAPFPDLTLVPINGLGTGGTPAVNNATIVAFAVGCVSCELNNRLEQIELLNRRVRATPGRRFMMIVPASDPTWTKSLQVFVRTDGVASTDIFKFSPHGAEVDSYWTRYRWADARPMVIDTGLFGEITAIHSLDARAAATSTH